MRGLSKQNGKETTPTTESELIGIDVDDRRRSLRRLRRTSVAVWAVWGGFSRTPLGATHALSCGVPDRDSNEVPAFPRSARYDRGFPEGRFTPGRGRNHLGGASKISSPAEDKVGSMRLEGDGATEDT